MASVITQKSIVPAVAKIGQVVSFTYQNKDGEISNRVGYVTDTYTDRFLLTDFTEHQNPRMFLFPRITNCELLEWAETPAVEVAEKKNLGYYLRRIFGFA